MANSSEGAGISTYGRISAKVLEGVIMAGVGGYCWQALAAKLYTLSVYRAVIQKIVKVRHIARTKMAFTSITLSRQIYIAGPINAELFTS